MKVKPVLLSICIPTFNRADILADMLQRLTSDPDFDQEVEIIISDNCSTDHTRDAVSTYCEEYPNVHYHCNEKNVIDSNFAIALSHGKGEYLKLINDYIYFSEGSLAYMKACIRSNQEKKIPLFFTHNVKKKYKGKECINCHSLEEYVDTVSHFVTWISSFGCWKVYWDQLKEKERFVSLSLTQVDWTFRLISSQKACLIYTRQLLSISPTPLGSRSGYNFFKVHIENYYSIMTPYLASGDISDKAYKLDRRYVFGRFKKQIRQALFFKKKEFAFDTKDTLYILWKYFKSVPALYFYMPFYGIGSVLAKSIKPLAVIGKRMKRDH